MAADPSSTSPPSNYPPLPHTPHTLAPIAKGQTFASLNAFKDHIRTVAFSQHWEPSVANSNRSKVQIKCRSRDDCPFKIWCRMDVKTGMAIISNVEGRHSCLGAPLTDRNQGSRLKFLEQEIPKIMDVSDGVKISGQQVVDAILARHGFEVSLRQAQRAIRSLRIAQHERGFGGGAAAVENGDGLGDTTLGTDMDESQVDDGLDELQDTTARHQYMPPPLHHQRSAPPPPPPPPPPTPPVQPQHHRQQPQHQHQPARSNPHHEPNNHQSQYPTEVPPRRGFVLQTPSGELIQGTPHELMLVLRGAIESGMT